MTRMLRNLAVVVFLGTALLVHSPRLQAQDECSFMGFYYIGPSCAGNPSPYGTCAECIDANCYNWGGGTGACYDSCFVAASYACGG
jgi:hypothetical protein